jgi:hypothetical protein
MPIVRQIFVTSTNMAQPSAIFELAFHPRPNHLLLRVTDDLLGDFNSAVRKDVPLMGSGVYAVVPLRSGLNKFALGRLDLWELPVVGGRGVR